MSQHNSTLVWFPFLSDSVPGYIYTLTFCSVGALLCQLGRLIISDCSCGLKILFTVMGKFSRFSTPSKHWESLWNQQAWSWADSASARFWLRLVYKHSQQRLPGVIWSQCSAWHVFRSSVVAPWSRHWYSQHGKMLPHVPEIRNLKFWSKDSFAVFILWDSK